MISVILALLSFAQNLNQNLNQNFFYQKPAIYKGLPASTYLNPSTLGQSKSKDLLFLPSQRNPQNIQTCNSYSANCRYVVKKGILLPILPSKTKIGYLNSNIIFLADQLLTNMDVDIKKYPVIVTTFVNLDNFKETSSLGRLLKENLVHELQVRGWKVIDINYMPKIKINKYGEFVLTRDMRKLTKKYKVSSILVGTYAIADNALIVNARIINAKNGLIISTGQFEIPLSYVESLLQNNAIKPVEILVTGE